MFMSCLLYANFSVLLPARRLVLMISRCLNQARQRKIVWKKISVRRKTALRRSNSWTAFFFYRDNEKCSKMWMDGYDNHSDQ